MLFRTAGSRNLWAEVTTMRKVLMRDARGRVVLAAAPDGPGPLVEIGAVTAIEHTSGLGARVRHEPAKPPSDPPPAS